MGSSKREEEDEDEKLKVIIMGKELYEAAMCNYSYIIDMWNEEELQRKTFELNNMLHIAVRYKSMKFVEKALEKFPHLLWDHNLEGNTPLHIAAQTNCLDLVRLVCDQNPTDPMPLRVRNSLGNTPFHVAIIHHNFGFVDFLLDKDPHLVVMVNNSLEAPLHLALKHFPNSRYETDSYDKMIERDEENKLLVKRIEQKNWKEGYPYGRYKEEEQMVRLIGLLLEKASYISGHRDASGLTPLHRATQLNNSYNLLVVKCIIDYCPPSMEVRDCIGKTILHHLINRVYFRPRGLDFIRQTHMVGLINHQDLNGNTPLHLAMLNSDVVMVRLLMEDFKADKFIANNEGMSPAVLMKQPGFTKIVREGLKMTPAISYAAELGDVFLLREYWQELGFFEMLLKDSDEWGVLHKLLDIKSGRVIIPEGFFNFLKQFCNNNLLEVSTDKDGNTPIHILARLSPNNIYIYLASQELNSKPLPSGCGPLHSSFSNFTYSKEILGDTTILTNLANFCLEKTTLLDAKANVKGNTVFHEAAIAKNYPVLEIMAEFFRGSVKSVNNKNETVLHLLAQLFPAPRVSKATMEDIIEKNTRDESHDLNDEGLSPLMIAIQAGNIEFAEMMVSISPRLARVKDSNGLTFWHYFVKSPPIPILSFKFANTSFISSYVLSVLEMKDNEEVTPLHLAIENRQFDIARLFLSLHRTHQNHTLPLKNDLLRIPDHKGDTPGDKIGSLQYLPDEFENFLWEDSTMIGTRSMWGIPTAHMKDYVNTMGVIAALLTTITFTAAFTVPGGLNQETGTPLLIRDVAFQVFIISDVLAMCLSTMVLFCLLWIMAIGDKTKSVVLMDFSIILLLASFYTTLLTFMTGLYATLHLVKPWIAIFSLVPCSMLVLLMHRYLVIKWIIPSGKRILILVDMGYHSVKDTFQYANGLRKKCFSNIQKCYTKMTMRQPTDAHVV